MNFSRITRTLSLCILATHAAAQTITVLEGTTRSSLTIRLFDEKNLKAPSTVFLAGVEILPIEATNRTAQMEFVPGRSRIRGLQGLRCLDLPTGGKLFHYRRRGATTRYGYLLIATDGRPVVVHDLPGVGSNNQDNPYEDRIGIAPDGRHASITSIAGGLWVSRLDGQNFISSGTPSRPLSLPAGVLVETLAMVVGRTHLFVITDDDRIRRSALADGNQLQDLTPSHPAGSRLKDELAPSGTGDDVAFLLGPKRQFSIYLLRSTGGATKLPPKPAKYEEPGYLPETKGGPRLLLNGDASRLLYIDATVRDEIFLLDTAGSTGTTHITSDANFQPYIGVGIYPAFAAQFLVMAVGDAGAFDWFVSSTNSRAVINVTGTAARSSAPFDAGKLKPIRAFLAQDGALIATEQHTALVARVRRVDPVTGRSTFLVNALRGIPEMGATLGGLPTVLLPGLGGDTLLGLLPGKALLSGPPGVYLSPEITARAGAFSLFTAADAVSGLALPVIRFGGANILLGPITVGLRQVVLTKNDGALLNGRALQYFAAGVNVTLPVTTPIRIVLSGASN